ncbi:unnamed product, partial [Ostreococcus tauri]
MASPFAVSPPRALDEALGAWERVSDAVDDTGVELAADAQTLVKSIVTYARDGRWRRDKRVRASAEACARRASAKSETFRETLVLGASRAVTSGAFGDDECESLSRMVCLVLEEVE